MDIVRLYVGPELIDCDDGAGPTLCMEVSETGHGDYEWFYGGIEGFDHMVGVRYVIDVERRPVDDPPADGSSISYHLVETIEEQMISDGAGAGNGESETVRFYVGPELVDCVGVGPQTCLQVSETGHDDYELFYDGVEGFEPEVGTRYVIDVEATEIDDPPADASSVSYRLIAIIEQEQV